MVKLIRGILDFRKNVLPERKETFARLAKGQTPDVLFITCSDSRVAPNWFASTDPGDLFVVRNVGNIVPLSPPIGSTGSDCSVAAAIEFALLTLKVSSIVVCGHSGCGAIHALAKGEQKGAPSHLKHWLGLAGKLDTMPIDDDKSLSLEDRLSQRNVLNQIETLKTYPVVYEHVRNGKLKLYSWWFNIAEGTVYAFDEKRRQFVVINEEVGAAYLR